MATDGGRARIGWRAALVVLAIASLVRGAAWVADQRDRTIRLRVDCATESCTASVEQGEALVLPVPAERRGRAIGLYAYGSHELLPDPVFRDLRVRSANEVESARSLRERAELPFDPDALDTWSLEPGVGVRARPGPGERSVALLDHARLASFELAVDLVDAVDAGILFGATDASTGFVFVARSEHNDAFLFELRDGEPGAILGLTRIRPLEPGREALALAGLISEIVLAAALLLGLIVGVSRILPGARGTGPVAREHPPGWCVPVLLATTFAALSAVAWLGLERVPHIADETAYVFQARIFSEGHLWSARPGLPDFFLHEHLVMDGERWFAKYPPLFPALLALGMLAGVPWAVNPLLGALTALVTFLLIRDLTSWRWGIVGWLLLLTSPFFLIMGATLMSHMTSALLVATALWLTCRALARPSPWLGAGAGACVGLAIFARPYTALLAAAAIGLHGAWTWLRSTDRRALIAVGLAMVMAATPLAIGYAGWNSLYSGSFSLSLYDRYDTTDRLGFGPDKGAGWLMTWGSWGHTPAKALRSVERYLDYTSHHLLGWPLRLGLAIALLGFLPGAGPPGRERRLFALVFLALVGGHGLYWATQHLGYGARYWFEALPALLALVVLGARGAMRFGASDDGGPEISRAPAAIALGAVLVAWNAAAYLPDRLRELPRYGGIGADLQRAVAELGPERALVFVQTEGILYNDGFFMNDPWLGGDRIYARDLGPRNVDLMARYPDHAAYRWTSGTLRPVDATALAGRSGPNLD